MRKGKDNPIGPHPQQSRSPYTFGAYEKKAGALEAERQRLAVWRRKSGQPPVHSLWLEISIFLALAAGLYLTGLLT